MSWVSALHQHSDRVRTCCKHHESTIQAAGDDVMVWGIFFLAHFEPLSTNYAPFKCNSLREYFCWPRPSVYGDSAPMLWWLLWGGQGTMLQSSSHFKLVSWTWQSSPYSVTRSQTNITPLWCGGTGSFHLTVHLTNLQVWFHVNMDQSLSPWWPPVMKNLCSSKGKRGTNPILARCVTSEYILIKSLNGLQTKDYKRFSFLHQIVPNYLIILSWDCDWIAYQHHTETTNCPQQKSAIRWKPKKPPVRTDGKHLNCSFWTVVLWMGLLRCFPP